MVLRGGGRVCDREPVSAADPAVAAVRRAVRSALDGPPATVPVLVAYSGGADSTALLAAARAVAPDRVHVAVVDHALQDGSAERSAALVADLTGQGVPAAVHTVDVDGGGGLEAAARRARYAALRAARPHPDSPVLLGHTLDDQAETVLLGSGPRLGRPVARRDDEPGTRPGCGRCSGCAAPRPRPPAGPRAWSSGTTRTTSIPASPVSACATRCCRCWRTSSPAGWPRRSRARRRSCATTARRSTPSHATCSPGLRRTETRKTAYPNAQLAVRRRLDAAVLADAPAAIRRRALRAWLGARGVTGLTDLHLRAADDLVGRWRGQGAVMLPQRLELVREHGKLRVRTAAWPGAR